MSEGDQRGEHRHAEPRLPRGRGGAVRLRILLLVALGGAIGAVARYGIGGWVQEHAGTGFPWGTLTVNLLGSLLIGLAIGLLHDAAPMPELRAFLAAGLLGAFTTFSTYSYETYALLESGEWGRAVAYAGGSLALGLLAVFAGLAASGVLRGVVGPGAP